MSNKKKIILWGATGQSIVLEEFLDIIGYDLIAVFDNNKDDNPYGISIEYIKKVVPAK